MITGESKSEIFKEVTGQDLLADEDLPTELAGEPFDTDPESLAERFPRLWEKSGNS